MRIGIDARLRAYRGGGISEHVTRLLAGLAQLSPPEEIVVLDHWRGAGRGVGNLEAPDEPPVARPTTQVGDEAPALSTATGAAAARAPDSLQSGAAAPPPARFESLRLHTPPHHRLEGWALPLELLPARLDLLHSTDSIVPRAWRGPAVATVHDVAFLRRPELLTSDSLRYYGRVRQAVLRADRVIAVSRHTRAELLELTDVDADNVRVIPNAIPNRCFAPGDPDGDRKAIDGRGLRDNFVLFVSTIEPRKNVDTLLRAFRRLIDAGRDIDLALVGADGWRSAETYQLAAELGLGDRARFLGFVSDDELGALYRRAAVMAHPAVDEGFGLTPLEAMAAGAPTVVSDVAGLRETVGEAALLAPPHDERAWADGVARLLDDPALRSSLRNAGRARAREFSVERMARSTLDVYREVLTGRPGARERARPAREGRSAPARPDAGRSGP
ncbi:MAG: glycosyltransferase family 4 protein [Anaerolineae bacterium]